MFLLMKNGETYSGLVRKGNSGKRLIQAEISHGPKLQFCIVRWMIPKHHWAREGHSHYEGSQTPDLKGKIKNNEGANLYFNLINK